MSNIDDILPLPAQVEVRMFTPDMIVLRNVVPEWRNELIQIAEKIQRWRQSGQVRPGVSEPYHNTYRTSRSFVVTASDPLYGPCLRRFEMALINVFHSGLLAFKNHNPYLTVTHDSGFEMLRYRVGEQFDVHCDAILGRNEGFRQLSAILYLNDDYTGGETHFPRQAIKFKAQAGDLLLFPSTFCYPHESMPVTEGTKYAVVTWFMAYPKLQAEKDEETHGDQGEDDVCGADAPVDGGVCVQQPAGGGSSEGEPAASDRVDSACVGGRAG